MIKENVYIKGRMSFSDIYKKKSIPQILTILYLKHFKKLFRIVVTVMCGMAHTYRDRRTTAGQGPAVLLVSTRGCQASCLPSLYILPALPCIFKVSFILFGTSEGY